MHRRPTLLLAGGLDPLGGAGITADATLASTLGLAPLPVAVAIVEQDSFGVRAVGPFAPASFGGSFRAALVDGRPSIVKLGVIGSVEAARWLAAELLPWLRADAGRRLVLDPVLRGGTPDGAALAPAAMLPSLRHLLTPQTIVTPNASELLALCGLQQPAAPNLPVDAAVALHRQTGAAFLLKSGHTSTPGQDSWLEAGVITPLDAHPRWPHDLHGTGCFVATALAAGLARGLAPRDAARAATNMLARLVAEGGLLQVGAGRAQLLHASARW